MYLSNLEKPIDPNYAHLKMLSFAYKPQPLSGNIRVVYGMIVEFSSDPFTVETKFLTFYDSGFAALYSTHSGGNINGNACLSYSQNVVLSSFESFIGCTTKQFPDATISKRTRQLLTDACDYTQYTEEALTISNEKEIKFWFLTSSGVFSAGANLFEIKDKSSVWTNLFNEAYSIGLTLPSGDSDKGTRYEAVSY